MTVMISNCLCQPLCIVMCFPDLHNQLSIFTSGAAVRKLFYIIITDVAIKFIL